MRKLWLIFALCLFSAPAWAAGGTCPSGSTYINTYVQPNTVGTLAALGVTACYYVGPSGLDTNTGQDETHPFLHAPGMSGCASNCSSATTSAGTGFIFEGGYILHYGSGSPSQSGTWNWTHSGTSSNKVYLGVDPTWHSGGSFARPILTGDNVPPTFGGSGTTAGSFVSSCPTADNSALGGFLELGSGVTYVVVDGFEFTGYCWLTGGGSHDIFIGNTSTLNNSVIENYHHGWSTNGTTDDKYAFYQAATGSSGNVYAYNVVDGSDSSYGASTNTTGCHYSGYAGNAPCYTGSGLYLGGFDIHGNVFRHLSNVAVTQDSKYFYSNYITDVNITSQASGQHQNCNNMVGNTSGGDVYTYSNLVTEYTASECFYFAPPAGHTGYFFNNVFWGNMRVNGVGTFPTNCILLNVSQSASTATAYIYNNTVSQAGGSPVTGAGCEVQLAPSNSPLNPWNGPVHFSNNHLVGTAALSGFYSVNGGAGCNAGTCPITDDGGQVYETEATANSQGYTYSNNYAPTLIGNPTVGAGTNYTSSCPTFSTDSGLCMATTWASEVSGWGGYQSIVPGVNGTASNARPSSGAWDAGAYQFSATSSIIDSNLQGVTNRQGATTIH